MTMCDEPDCSGCAYSTFSSLLHSGPHRECYRRFLVRHAPWKMVRRVIDRSRFAVRERRVEQTGKGKEVWREELGGSFTVTATR
jgi:hypothetical protein